MEPHISSWGPSFFGGVDRDWGDKRKTPIRLRGGQIFPGSIVRLAIRWVSQLRVEYKEGGGRSGSPATWKRLSPRKKKKTSRVKIVVTSERGGGERRKKRVVSRKPSSKSTPFYNASLYRTGDS